MSGGATDPTGTKQAEASLTMEEQPWRAGRAPEMMVTWRRPSHGCRSQLKAGNHDSSTRRKSSSKYICVWSTRH